MYKFILPALLALSCSGSKKTTAAAEPAPTKQAPVLPTYDFRALGQEPSWNATLTIGKDLVIQYNGETYMAPVSEGIRPQDAYMITYRASNENATVLFRVIGDTCMDSMSGEKFPYRVEVDLMQERRGNITLKGCGRYYVPPALNDIWALHSVDGEPYQSGSTPQHPMLEFNIASGAVHGNDGCNSFGGEFTREDDYIRFMGIHSTLMACHGNPVLTKVYETLSIGTFQFSMEGRFLILHGFNGTTLTYKKVD